MFEKLSIKYNINFQKLVILLIISSLLILGISIMFLFVMDDSSEEDNIVLNESENNIKYVEGDVELYITDNNDNIITNLDSEGDDVYIYETGSFEIINSNTDDVVDSFVISDSNVLNTSFEVIDDTLLQAKNEIVFHVNETYDDDVIKYAWNFDDDSELLKTDNESITYEFESGGEYTVTLKAVDSQGNIDSYSKDINVEPDELIALASVDDYEGYVTTDFEFDAIDSLNSSNYAIDSYNWYFGDSNQSEGESVTHNYNQSGFYEVVLEVIDSDGESDTDNITIDVDDTSIEGEFEVNKTSGFVGEYFEFNIISASTSGTDIDEIKWDFDDGTTKKDKYDVEYSFNETGKYEVNLTLVADDGTKDTDSETVTVNETSISANAYSNETEKEVNETFALNASNSTSEGVEIEEYNWDFDDNNTKTGEFVNHSFNETGEYKVNLTIVDENGNESKDSINLTATSGLNAVIDVDEKEKGVEEIFEFSGDDSTANNTDIKSYEWNFGDGMTKEGKNVSYVYTEPEIYVVGLTIIGEDGMTDSETITVEVVD